MTSNYSNPTLLKVSSVVGVTFAVFLLDWFYLMYVTVHGFETRTQKIMLGSMSFSFPLQWLPVIGIVLLSLVVWYEESARIFPRRGGLQVDPLASLRLFKVISASLAAFVLMLYLPNVLGSNWFWGVMSSVSQMHGFALSLLNTENSVVAAGPIWRYSLSQLLAATAMVLSAWIFGGGAKRPRR